MKICFTIDDVIRAKTVQIGKIYKRNINCDIDLDALDFSTNDYQEIFNFKTKGDWQKFLYSDYAYEIFGEAPVTTKGVDKEFNLWLIEMQDIDEEFEIMLANPFEFNASIGFTCFFLSKIASRVRELYFPLDSSEIWNKCDVLVTADPKLIEEKPEGKICVKINMPYNKDLEADYSFDSLSDALKENKMVRKLIDNAEY